MWNGTIVLLLHSFIHRCGTVLCHSAALHIPPCAFMVLLLPLLLLLLCRVCVCVCVRARVCVSEGVEAVIVGGAVSEIAQHFATKHNLLILKIISKFELRRICQTLGATALVRLGAPLPEEMGHAESIVTDEISSRKVTIIRALDSKVSTIVLRGGTQGNLDEIERSIVDALNCAKAALRNSQFVCGAAACEMLLASKLQAYARTVPGLAQYGIAKFASAFECVPRVLAANSGRNPTETVAQLYAAILQGHTTAGVDVKDPSSAFIDTAAAGILDHKATKATAVSLATDAAVTVLRVDQIIRSRPAGGPKPPQQTGAWDQD
eukprot:GHVU01013124.1.p2 GENE.GHVU01013124.1~~GHVU01013124.1.p2  ORF type:complete len:321 (+),score=76.12 GHVU01013124.1:198-1160(+)